MTIVRNTDNIIEVTIEDFDGNPLNLSLFSDIQIYLYSKPKNILQQWSSAEGQTTPTGVNTLEVYVDRENMKLAIKGQLFIEVVVLSFDANFADNLRRQASPDNELAVLIDSPTARTYNV